MNPSSTTLEIGITQGAACKLRKPLMTVACTAESRLVFIHEIIIFNGVIDIHWRGLESVQFQTAQGEVLIINFEEEISKDEIASLLLNEYIEVLPHG
jgi:hypothetical protein